MTHEASANEGSAREEALRDLAILDTPPEEGFDDAVLLAAAACGTATAMVSLVAADRQWFKASVGTEFAGSPISDSVCAHALRSGGTLVIPDLSADGRTAKSSFVTAPGGARFYAGTVLRDPDGVAVGTLCVLDKMPRPNGLAAAELESLERIGRQVSTLLAYRKTLAERDRLDAAQKRAVSRLRSLLAFGDAVAGLADGQEIARTASGEIGRALGCSRVGFSRLAPRGSIITVMGEWVALGEEGVAGSYRADTWAALLARVGEGRPIVIADPANDPLTAGAIQFWRRAGVASLALVPVSDEGAIVGHLYLHSREGRSWDRLELDYARDLAGRMMAEIARAEARERENLLSGEVHHRLKNMLAMVGAIIVQTLRESPSLDAAASVVTARIAAMGEAQDVLVRGGSTGAALGEVVASALKPFEGVTGRFDVVGPPVGAGPKVAMGFALVLHELATNAAKYGALSIPDGRVAISWKLVGEEGDVSLAFEWRESGGPPVSPPTRLGFGSKMLKRGFPPQVDVDHLFDLGGVACRIGVSCRDLAL